MQNTILLVLNSLYVPKVSIFRSHFRGSHEYLCVECMVLRNHPLAIKRFSVATHYFNMYCTVIAPAFVCMVHRAAGSSHPHCYVRRELNIKTKPETSTNVKGIVRVDAYQWYNSKGKGHGFNIALYSPDEWEILWRPYQVPLSVELFLPILLRDKR